MDRKLWTHNHLSSGKASVKMGSVGNEWMSLINNKEWGSSCIILCNLYLTKVPFRLHIYFFKGDLWLWYIVWQKIVCINSIATTIPLFSTISSISVYLPLNLVLWSSFLLVERAFPHQSPSPHSSLSTCPSPIASLICFRPLAVARVSTEKLLTDWSLIYQVWFGCTKTKAWANWNYNGHNRRLKPRRTRTFVFLLSNCLSNNSYCTYIGPLNQVERVQYYARC